MPQILPGHPAVKKWQINIFQQIRTAWLFLQQGRCQLYSWTFLTPQCRHRWITIYSEVLGEEYVRCRNGTGWAATVRIEGLKDRVWLNGPGSQPTADLLSDFETLARRLPEIIAKSGIGDPPSDDGWGNAPPPFDLLTARVSQIWMQDNGSFFLTLNVDDDHGYMLAPCFWIASDFTLVNAEWNP